MCVKWTLQMSRNNAKKERERKRVQTLPYNTVLIISSMIKLGQSEKNKNIASDKILSHSISYN